MFCSVLQVLRSCPVSYTHLDVYKRQLGEDGRSGRFYQYMVQKVEDAATVYLNKLSEGSLDVPYTLNDCLSWDGSSAKITLSLIHI